MASVALTLARAHEAPPAATGGDLVLRGLAKRFGAHQVLAGVDLAVPAGQSLALIGPNGCGKSTLLRCTLRLLEPDAGAVTLLGADVRSLGTRRLRNLRADVGFVFQRHNLVPRLSALSNVLHGAQARAFGPLGWSQAFAPRELREEALHCLDQVGLANLAGRRADRLSGGQSQRVAIARALMQRPRMMFADEPVASLDPAAGEEVMALFADLVRARGLTLVFTTHDLTHARAFGDRIVGLRGGRLALDAPPDRLGAAELRGFYD